jgi:lysophospholipase L1-like esterase
VALGDSYTIGTQVGSANGRWPNQLVARLAASSTPLDLVANLAVNGFTSADVIATELPRLPGLAVEFASLLVGVNDVVQGVDDATYRANVATILDALLDLLPSDRVLTVATPDYTVTPHGADYGDSLVQAAAIRRVNASLSALAAQRGIVFVDIHDLSLRAEADRGLVAADGLHPSARQYGLWVDRIAPVVERLLEAEAGS